MGRRLVRVPPGWQHPRINLDPAKPYLPLFTSNFASDLAIYRAERASWERGFGPEGTEDTYEEWDGPEPNPLDYLPQWSYLDATHWQVYETVTEGSPITAVHADPQSAIEELANIEARHGSTTTSYQWWCALTKNGQAERLLIPSDPFRIEPSVRTHKMALQRRSRAFAEFVARRWAAEDRDCGARLWMGTLRAEAAMGRREPQSEVFDGSRYYTVAQGLAPAYLNEFLTWTVP